jgi:hypothetical protein
MSIFEYDNQNFILKRIKELQKDINDFYSPKSKDIFGMSYKITNELDELIKLQTIIRY